MMYYKIIGGRYDLIQRKFYTSVTNYAYTGG